MDPAAACACSNVNIKCVTRKKKRSLDFVKLQKVLGPSNLNWFDDLSAKAVQKRLHDPDTTTPKQLLVNPESPCFQRQQVELLQAATPGMCSLTPLSAWALLSSQDPNTSTPSSLDRPIIGNRLDLLSPPLVDSCLKTCKGISERLGLPTDDTNLSWTNSMATPCLGGDAQQSQESLEVTTPAPKPKGFPRALFSPEVGRGDSDELVRELSVTMDEDILSCRSPHSQIPATPPMKSDLRKNMMKELFLRSSGQTDEVLVSQEQHVVEKEGQNLNTSSPAAEKKDPMTPEASSSPITPQSAARRLIKRRNIKTALVRSPLVHDVKQMGKEYEKVIDIDEDVQLKINILRTAASFEGDMSVFPGSCLKEKLYVSDTDTINQSSSGMLNIKADDEIHLESALQQRSTSPLLNRKVRKMESHCQIRRNRHPVSNTEVNTCGTRTVVSHVLSDFMDSPSSVQSMRRSPPNKGQKRKSVDDPLKDGILFSTPSPLGSQSTGLHSILSSSKKRKMGSSSKRVRFAERLCQREGEAPTVVKKLDYVRCSVIDHRSAFSDACNEDSSSTQELISKNGEATFEQTCHFVEVNQSSVVNDNHRTFSNSEGKLSRDSTMSSVPDGEQILFEPEPVLEEKSGTGYDSESKDTTRCSSETAEDISVVSAMNLQTLHTGVLSEKIVSNKIPEEVVASGDDISGNMPDPAISEKEISNTDHDASSSVHSKCAEEMFSQVSPSSLTKMCLVADSNAPLEKTEVVGHLISQTQSQSTICDIEKHSMARSEKVVGVCDSDKDFPQTKDLSANTKDVKKLEALGGTRQCVQYNNNNSSDVSSVCETLPVTKVPHSVSDILDTDLSCKKEISSKVPPRSSDVSVKQTPKVTMSNLFSNKIKPKKFFYPTSSQIKSVCPESVYNFKGTESDSKTTVSNGGSGDSTNIHTGKESHVEEDLKNTGSVSDQLVDQMAEPTVTVNNLTDDTDPKTKITFSDSEHPAEIVQENADISLKKVDTQYFSMGLMKFSEMFEDNMDDDLDVISSLAVRKREESQVSERILQNPPESKDNSIPTIKLCSKFHHAKSLEGSLAEESVKFDSTAPLVDNRIAEEKGKVGSSVWLEIDGPSNESGQVDKSVSCEVHRRAQGCVKVDLFIQPGDESTAQKKFGGEGHVLSVSVTNSLDVQSMVQDVQEELFSDIEFSQKESNNQVSKDSTGSKETITDKNGDILVDTAMSKDEILLKSTETELTKQTEARGDGKSATSDPDDHVFKMPDIPGRSIVQKPLMLSDSDTDNLLSDMDLSGSKDSDKPNPNYTYPSRLEDIKFNVFSSDASDFETCVSEQESTTGSRNLKDANSGVSSSVSDSDTEAYVTSTEEMKETSPEGNKKVPRSKLTARSRSSRHNSVLLCKSQMMSDSDSDINPSESWASNMSKKRKSNCSKHQPKPIQYESPVVVSESNPLVVWSELESHDVCQRMSASEGGCDNETFPKIKLENEKHESDNGMNMEEPSEMVVKGFEKNLETNGELTTCTSGTESKLQDGPTATKKTSRPCSISDWSDLEPGEADEAEQEVIFAASASRIDNKTVEQEMQNKNDCGELCINGTTDTVESNGISSEFVPNSNAEQLMMNKVRTNDIKEDIKDRIENEFSKGSISLKTSNSKEMLGDSITDGIPALTSIGFSTAGGRKIELDMNSLQKASSLLECDNKLKDCNFSTLEKDISRESFPGFSSASGKHVDLDAKSLQKAAVLFDEKSITAVDKNDLYASCSMQSKRKKTSINVSQVNACFQESSGVSVFPSFSTASGRTLTLNEDALRKAQTMLVEVPEDAASQIPLSKRSADCVLTKTSNPSSICDSIPSSADGDELESILDDLLKSKKSLGEQSQTEKSDCKSSKSQEQTCTFNNDSIEEKFNANFARPSLTLKITSVNGFSAARKTGKNAVSSKANIKGDPMLKPKGFRPFKKPRIVQKPKLGMKDDEEVHLPIGSVGGSSGDTVEGLATVVGTPDHLKSDSNMKEMSCPGHDAWVCVSKPLKVDISEYGTSTVEHLSDVAVSDSVKSDSDMSEMLLLEFSRDMTELSQVAQAVPIAKPPLEIAKPQLSNQICRSNNFTNSSSATGSDAHLMLMDVLFEGDMSSQMDMRPNIDPKKESKTRDGHSKLGGQGENIQMQKGDLGCVEAMFQTASGKDITISENSLDYSGKVWSDVAKDRVMNTCIMKVLENQVDNVVPSGYNISEEKVQPPSVIENASKTEEITEQNSQEDEQSNVIASHEDGLGKGTSGISDSVSSLFQTASGRNVSVSVVSLVKAKNTLRDDTSDKRFDLFPTASGKSVAMSEMSMKKAQEMWNKTPVGDDITQLQRSGCFQIVSGKGLNESEKAVAKEILKNNQKLSDASSSSFQTASVVPKKSEKILDKCSTHEEIAVVQEMGEKVDKALAKGKILWNDGLGINEPPSTCLFETALDADVNISSESLQEAQKLKNENLEQNSECSTSSLFKTASGVSVAVSVKSLAEGKKLLADENKQTCETSVTGFFQTTCGASASLSAKVSAQGKKLWADKTSKTAETSVSSLFQTASGTSVSVSDRSLAQGKKLWADETNKTAETSVLSLFQTASGTSVSVLDKSLAQGKKLWADKTNKTAETPVTSLFQTASGISVSVSNKSLAQGKKLWADETSKTAETSVSSLFQTASGISVSVSDKSFAQGKKLWADETNKTAETPVTSLFQTASGISVSVSNKSLAQGKKLWADETSKTAETSVSSLFQTASGISVSVSDKSLAQGKKLWADETSKTAETSVTSLFQTASGISVSVSDKSLAQGKKLWTDETSKTAETSVTSLFQTASGISVSVSDKSLAQGKKLWADGNNQGTVSSSLSLFQTASGTSVNVSSRSLEKGRRLMNDADSEIVISASVLESQNANIDRLVDGEMDVAVGPQGLVADGTEEIQDRQSSRTADMTCRLDDNNSSRTPLVSTPEAVFLDHYGRSGRRFAPVLATSLTSSARRSEEYTIEAVTSTASRGTSSSFKTPYKNSAFVTPVRRTDAQQRLTHSEGKTPVFYPKASLRTSRNVSRDNPSSQNLSRVMLSNPNCDLSKQSNRNECRQGLTSRNLSCNQLPAKTLSAIAKTGKSSINSTDVDDGVPEGISLPVNQLVEEKHDMPSNDERNGNCSKNTSTLSNSSTIIKLGKVDTMLKDESSDMGPQKRWEKILNESVSTDIKSCLEDARRKQEEIIQCKKKQKIRPCSGCLLTEKSLSQQKLHYRDFLKDRCHSDKELWSSGVKSDTYDIRSCNAEEFRFRLVHFYPQLVGSVLVGDGAELVSDDSGFAGKEEFYRSFLTLEGVDPKLTSDVWVYNHYRWIVWKMAAYEIALPTQFGGICLTPNNVMLQLKYRYDREVDHCHRSALKKIVERDDAACKRMVLCIANIKNGPSGIGENSATSVKFLELTDGWYSLTAQLDIGLMELVERKKICVGDKICVSGAELTGSQDACTPLEIPDSLHLKISMNSTRPAPWDSKLGYQRDPRPLSVPVSSLHAEGGVVGCVDVVVTRIYPLMYMEKLPEGGSVFRTEEAEERVQRQFDQQKQDKMEKLYTELQCGLENNDGKGRRKSRKHWRQKEVEELQTGQEIYEALEGSLQPEELHSWLSPYQRQQMEEHQRRLQESQQQQLQDKLHKAWEDAQQGETSRNVTPVLKLRLSGCAKRDIDAKTSPIVTVWRPSAEWLGLQEGKRYKMFGLTATAARTRLDSHSVHLTATRQTRLQHLPVDENYLDLVYEPREVWQVRDLRSRCPAHKEFDFGGIVVSHSTDSQRNCDTLVVADADGDPLNIRFWGRMQSFGVEDQLSQGKCFLATNLILKGAYGTVVADACHEVSRFSSSSKIPSHRKYLTQLTSMTKAEKQKFMETVQSKLSNHQTRNSAPTQQITTPEKFFSDLPSECLQRLFSPMEEATTTKVDNSVTPDATARKRHAALRERSSKLLAYGSPKPLSPLTVQISPAASKAFKSPFSLTKNVKNSNS